MRLLYYNMLQSHTFFKVAETAIKPKAQQCLEKE